MSTEKLNTEIRQEQIAQAAMELVVSQGLRNLNVAAVAERVGIVPSAIYRHFRNKDELLEAVLDLIQDRFLAHITAVREETQDSLRRLEALLMRHIQIVQKNQAIPRLIFSDDFSVDRPERKARVYEIITSYLDNVAEIIHQGQQEGQIRQDIDPKTISIMFLGLVQQAGVLWHLSNGRFEAVRHAQESWRIFRESVGTHESSQR
ncbi:MAG: TetR/AcrR family transcriptional regulator [bacterium]